MSIYIVYGTYKNKENYSVIDILKAFIFRENAEKFCKKKITEYNNQYDEIIWEETNLE